LILEDLHPEEEAKFIEFDVPVVEEPTTGPAHEVVSNGHAIGVGNLPLLCALVFLGDSMLTRRRAEIRTHLAKVSVVQRCLVPIHHITSGILDNVRM